VATWLEKSRSPEYSPAKLSQMLAAVESIIGIDELDEAMAHETIIVGGYLNTHLIKAGSIVAEHIRSKEITADKVTLEGLTTVNGLFKILEDGSIEATDGRFSGVLNSTSGVIGGFDISENGLTKSFTKTWGPFTLEDLERVQQIILRFEELTQADLDKYDIDGSGYLNGLDMFDMNRMRLGYDPYTVQYTMSLNTDDMRRMLVFSSTLNRQETRLGVFGIDAPTGRFENVIIDGYKLRVESDGSVTASPEQ
jgi:hypothetical protein